MDKPTKSAVWVRPDLDAEAADTSAKRIKLASGSLADSGFSSGMKLSVQRQNEPFSDRFPVRPGHGGKGLVRQASNVELSMSRPARDLMTSGSPLKAIQAQTPNKRNTIKKKEPLLFRKCRTDPLFRALCDEIQKETGTIPQIPEKDEHPFEPPNLADRLHTHWTSPTMFAQAPPETEDFKWGVHHLAELQPVDVENRVDILRTEIMKRVHDDSDEERAQENIRQFFNGVCDIPSPNTQDPTMSMFVDLESDVSEVIAERRGVKINAQVRDADCQTEIHISPNFDFNKYFADFKIHMAQQRRLSESCDGVRRRLFSDDEDEAFSGDLNGSLGFVVDENVGPKRSSGFGEDFKIHADVDFNLSSVDDE